MKPVTYKSSDGLEIPAYLTLPKGVAPKNLPTLMVPHGGPWGRDQWGYNSIAQFLANRGYAVLEHELPRINWLRHESFSTPAISSGAARCRTTSPGA